MVAPAFCIHGHFYQPPREDPMTGVIPQETGATPHRNWNERIHAECYRPNAEEGNFERMSFNFGPTLSAWMAAHDQETHRQIVEQDRANVRRYGVGNAIAQSYNHTILPLASYEDKVTQIAWGVADFEHRFGRKPQGMWLPETAVDNETLAVMAEQGITFTILAPWQAEAHNLDTTEPYRVMLPNGRSIAVFFYQQDLSGRISFDPTITLNADGFVHQHLAPRYAREKIHQGQPQLVLVASDGELYGHHQPFRDKFLSYLLNRASAQAGIVPTYLARWLNEHPPRRTIQIRDNTSWSCHHGVVRWMDDCGCTPNCGRWKFNLRTALNHIATRVDALYQEHAGQFVSDPWELRHRYVHVLLGNLPVGELIGEMSKRRLRDSEQQSVRLLLDAQYERQRAFTSCGWFFEDFDRIEPKNNVRYAAQAVWLTQQATGVELEREALALLQHTASDRTGRRADQVFAQHLRRTRHDNHAARS